MWTSKLTDILGALDYVRVSDNMWTSKLTDVLGALDYVRVSERYMLFFVVHFAFVVICWLFFLN